MPRRSKKSIACSQNVQNAAHVKEAAFERAIEDSPAGHDDNYEPPTKQSRQVTNSSTLCFMMIGTIGSIMSDVALCKECKQGTLEVTVLSNSGYNTHLSFTCNNCGFERQKWSGEDNMSDAVFMAAKYAGIKSGQLDNWSKCMNMGYTNEKGQHCTVTSKSSKGKKTNEKLNIRLDEMKKKDEKGFLQSLLGSINTDNIKLAVDGMYPIRNNSGICVSTVMAKINGQCRIIGNFYKKHSFSEKHSLEKHYFCFTIFSQKTLFFEKTLLNGYSKILYFVEIYNKNYF